MVPAVSHTKQIVLASGSPRRAQLLDQLRVSYHINPADIDETSLQNEDPAVYVERLARTKAGRVKFLLSGNQRNNFAHLPILAADTCVAYQGQLFGKPQGREEAVQRLLELSDRTHSVYTGAAIVSGSKCIGCAVRTDVTFRQISADEAASYWATGEPQGKAGGYAIQGMGAAFIRHLVGSYSNVMGLPLYETTRLLKLADIHIF